ncbi:hypothetical protein RclHR1_08200007 [Rhizophagus clarus]|uniref:Uncharacterized protein n=1 Tax=Rhizophagus clarus TaxID=94130 RepID=A0A2Z6SBB2_9GLOM|nr:hypothetical protein RclHR1_08200007 [Rhizophagus clarus]
MIIDEKYDWAFEIKDYQMKSITKLLKLRLLDKKHNWTFKIELSDKKHDWAFKIKIARLKTQLGLTDEKHNWTFEIKD